MNELNKLTYNYMLQTQYIHILVHLVIIDFPEMIRLLNRPPKHRRLARPLVESDLCLRDSAQIAFQPVQIVTDERENTNITTTIQTVRLEVNLYTENRRKGC